MTTGVRLLADHLHAIEYYRMRDTGHRDHVYTEVIDDQGFVFVHDPDRRENWLVRYARICAEDYLARVHAEHGRWLVHVFRLLNDERRHVISIHMQWPQPTV